MQDKQTLNNLLPKISFPLGIIMLAVVSACGVENNSKHSTQNQLPTPFESSPSAEVEEISQMSLDLREANVVAVTVEHLGEGSYRFDVTLHHDDEGEAPNYADFWHVEDLEGTVLGKRILTHSHSNDPFTRSETITIPEDITIVIVRGHDMNHGFGGQAMKVDLSTGDAEAFYESVNPAGE